MEIFIVNVESEKGPKLGRLVLETLFFLKGPPNFEDSRNFLFQIRGYQKQ